MVAAIAKGAAAAVFIRNGSQILLSKEPSSKLHFASAQSPI